MKAGSRRALVVEDDAASRDALSALLAVDGFEVRTAATLAAARAAVDEDDALDVVFLDLGLPDGDGMSLVGRFASLPSRCAVVMLTGERRVERVVEAMRAGASDFLTKPLKPALLAATLARVAERLADRDEARRLRSELIGRGVFQGLIGRSPQMRRLYEQIERVAPSALPVSVHGESGSGKELVARAIHDLSRRRRGPFVALNCGAIPRQLAESELFGHVRGAFTGAQRDHAGAFERASQGTLFLDEIAELPLDLQVVLLRVLEAGVVRRVGGPREVAVDVRIIAASHQDLAAAVAAGRFREDLYFRLHVLPLEVPALRDRPSDLPLLVEHFLAEAAAAAGTEAAPTLSEAARAAVLGHRWPGNVRELKNAIARGCVLRSGDRVEPEDLGMPSVAPDGGGAAGGPREDGVVVPFGATLADAERLIVTAQLDRHGWRRGETAEALGVSAKTLYNKCRAWDLQPPDEG
ncbi:MAG: sigma-54-dependent Fis family transcriptional regulator [Deltaproteobacteria bacterium HGW-Deltaproteobacteria-14]|nr:MAG: sigma-54-dependent Fis family transcriptional regulator [Deltaproteobacteria bacterium HGW-Deltaproteobacteria-14]